MKTEKTARITLTLEPALVAWLQERADATGKTLDAAFEDIGREAMARSRGGQPLGASL